tara:strand:+ start:1667 stop:2449 length:783 start_codon:yes stop_codon:yes gene_type:complete
MVLQTDQFGNVINTGTTFGRQAEAAEQGMLGLSNFMAMGGGFDEFLVRMAPQRALGNLPQGLTAGAGIKPSDIAAIKKSGMFGQLPSALTSAGFATPDARKATMKAGASRVAGMKRIPIAAGAFQALQGDPIGGLGTVGGGLIAQGLLRAAPAPVRLAGTIIGGMVGSRGTQAVAGINPSDPLSGPDISIPGLNIPLTPYARTKQQRERLRELNKEDLEQAQEFQRKQMAMQLANSMLMGQQRVSGTLANTMLQTSPFGR